MTTIDWESIPEGYGWVAVDQNGKAYAFKTEPELYPGYWGRMSMNPMQIHNVHTDNWKSSLQQRPSKQAAHECEVPVVADKAYTKEQLEAYFLYVGSALSTEDIDYFVTMVFGKSTKEREAVKFLTELATMWRNHARIPEEDIHREYTRTQVSGFLYDVIGYNYTLHDLDVYIAGKMEEEATLKAAIELLTGAGYEVVKL